MWNPAIHLFTMNGEVSDLDANLKVANANLQKVYRERLQEFSI